MKRRGMGRGLGRGYKNLVTRDPYVHGLSAKGVKTYKIGQTVYLKKTGEKWTIYDRNKKDNTYTIDGGDGLLFYGVKPSEFKKSLNAKDLSKEQKMKELKKMLGSDFVDDLQKAVKDIESSVPTTKHHYGKYMAILQKFPRSQWREITALLVFLGANREGLISAVQVLSAKGDAKGKWEKGYATERTRYYGKKGKKGTKDYEIWGYRENPTMDVSQGYGGANLIISRKAKFSDEPIRQKLRKVDDDNWYVAVDYWGAMERPDKLIEQGLSYTKAKQTVRNWMKSHPRAR